MSPAASRKRLPVDWARYDLASRLVLELKMRATVVGHPQGDEQKWLAAPAHENDNLIDLLDNYRTLLRERIEADAAEAGKVVPK